MLGGWGHVTVYQICMDALLKALLNSGECAIMPLHFILNVGTGWALLCSFTISPVQIRERVGYYPLIL